MRIDLKRADYKDAETIWKMQVEAFQDLYNKYHDTDTSPANEPLEKVIFRLNQPFTYFYIIWFDNNIVGAIRVVDDKDEKIFKRISPIFILKEYRNMGLAQETIKQVELIHGSKNWYLDTILQEKGNCYLYEKMGYKPTGETKKVNDNMTLIFYKK